MKFWNGKPRVVLADSLTRGYFLQPLHREIHLGHEEKIYHLRYSFESRFVLLRHLLNAQVLPLPIQSRELFKSPIGIGFKLGWFEPSGSICARNL